jgi:hypothetical protein
MTCHRGCKDGVLGAYACACQVDELAKLRVRFDALLVATDLLGYDEPAQEPAPPRKGKS